MSKGSTKIYGGERCKGEVEGWLEFVGIDLETVAAGSAPAIYFYSLAAQSDEGEEGNDVGRLGLFIVGVLGANQCLNRCQLSETISAKNERGRRPGG